VIARGRIQRRGRSLFDFMGTVIDANLTWLSRTAPRGLDCEMPRRAGAELATGGIGILTAI
jgi:hypothetical protein